jgi:hypothetical protein
VRDRVVQPNGISDIVLLIFEQRESPVPELVGELYFPRHCEYYALNGIILSGKYDWQAIAPGWQQERAQFAAISQSRSQ